MALADRAAPDRLRTRDPLSDPLGRFAADEPMLTGTARLVAAHLELPPIAIRLVLVVLTVAGGWGIVLYGVGWVFLVWHPFLADPPPVAPARRDEPRRTVGLVVATIGLLVLAREVGPWFADGLVWPVALVGLGATLVWHRLDQPSADSSSRSARRAQLVRVGGGLVLVIGGWSTFLGRNLGPGALRDGAAAAAVLLAGVALLLGPWLARLLVSVGEERDARVRAAERADVAAHLHDSVLQTLALLQKRADDPTAVSALARHQERELRRWLYGRQPDPDDVRFGDAVDAVVAEVEDHHLVRIEAVVVGDALVDDRLAALVAATREALVNAAKFSGTPDVSLYAELDGDAEVYVRDRGKGFDPELVPSDRRGIADSIVGRLARVGGTADVRSTPGEGTEVHLHLPAPTRYPHTRTGG